MKQKSSHKLEDMHKEYLLQALATAPFEGKTQQTIVKEFKIQFGFDISDSAVSYYKKEHADAIGKKIQETANVVIKTIPIAVKGFRLKAIWDIYTKCKAKDYKTKLMCLRSAQSETNDVGDKIADAIKNSGDKHYHFNFGDMPDDKLNRLASQYSRMLGTIGRDN